MWFLRTNVRQGDPSHCREDGFRKESILMWLIPQTFNRTVNFFFLPRALPFRCI